MPSLELTNLTLLCVSACNSAVEHTRCGQERREGRPPVLNDHLGACERVVGLERDIACGMSRSVSAMLQRAHTVKCCQLVSTLGTL